jgi:hypothetical protein
MHAHTGQVNLSINPPLLDKPRFVLAVIHKQLKQH